MCERVVTVFFTNCAGQENIVDQNSELIGGWGNHRFSMGHNSREMLRT
jgi:hypothetical protein